jgi:hypothetical protein
VSCLLTGSALAIDSYSRYGFWEPGCESRIATDVEGLLAHLRDTTPDHVVNDGRVDAGALYEALENHGGEIDGIDSAENSLLRLPDTDGRSDCSHDDCVAHV